MTSRISRNLSTAALLGTLCFGLIACGDTEVQQVVPSIRVRATHVDEKKAPLVDFGPNPVLIPSSRIIEIENLGRADLSIDALVIETEDEVFSLGEDLAGTKIPGGSSVELEVVFTPAELAAYKGALIIRSNDKKNPAVQVGVEGEGSTIGKLAYDPDVIDFGIVGEWTQATRTVRLRSVGTAPLLVGGAALGEGSSPAFAILGSSGSTRLPPPSDDLPGGEVSLTLSCAPTDETEGAEIEGVLTLQSTDPEQRDVQIPVRAKINRAPIADFEMGVEGRFPYGAIAMDGSASHDPDGHDPLRWTWRIHRQPAGANASFSDPSSPTPTFTTDTPGDYVIGLDVEDALDLPCRPASGDPTEPCATKALQIRSEDDLVIELVWDKGTDLDLHLVEEGGEFLTEDDCFWANPSPDFGEVGNPEDDPLFAKEAIKGPGMEEIVFTRPSPGRYMPAVVFAQELGAPNPSTTATLKIHMFGVQVAERTVTLDYAGQMWKPLIIDWPTGEIEFIDEFTDTNPEPDDTEEEAAP